MHNGLLTDDMDGEGGVEWISEWGLVANPG